ncbi:RNA-binding (RRM/RBD/RNP motifs) family protein [Trifolium repens]|nr:RNA-binding (RRM/RBD/RNP motifs) family protein [Trifolium repens]
MSGNSSCTVYIGNLDERVTDRVLYDILIQAGRVVDLHIPKDKESEKPKGFAFAEYETEEIADYAVKLFSGLVTLYKRTLKFAISGRDKNTPNSSTATTPTSNSSQRPRPYPVQINSSENFQYSSRHSIPDRFSDHPVNYSQVPPPHRVTDQPSGYGSHYRGNHMDYSRRIFGEALDNATRSSSGSRYSISASALSKAIVVVGVPKFFDVQVKLHSYRRFLIACSK